MVTRREDVDQFTHMFDVENHIQIIKKFIGGVATEIGRFYYDADGAAVKWKGTDGAITVTVGPHYEKNNATGISTSYYFFNGQRVAMRQGGTVYWIHGDQLGSTSLTTNVSGNAVGGTMRYKPFGEPRNGGAMPTDLRFTGQRELGRVGQGMGSLMFYGARAYSPVLGRFVSADTVVPGAGNPQAFNRYSYVLNRPLNAIDPGGHRPVEDCYPVSCYGSESNSQSLVQSTTRFAGNQAAKWARNTQSAFNARQITVLAFRGAGKLAGADSDELKASYPLAYYGHVGVQLKPGGPIYGMTPHAPGESYPAVVKNLVTHSKTYPGQVKDDTDSFVKAKDLADQGLYNGQTEVRALTFDFSSAPEEYDAIVAKVEADLAASPFDNPRYSFPLPDGSGRMPANCQNCATWVGSLGLDVPTTGQMGDFMDQFSNNMGATPW